MTELEQSPPIDTNTNTNMNMVTMLNRVSGTNIATNLTVNNSPAPSAYNNRSTSLIPTTVSTSDTSHNVKTIANGLDHGMINGANQTSFAFAVDTPNVATVSSMQLPPQQQYASQRVDSNMPVSMPMPLVHTAPQALLSTSYPAPSPHVMKATNSALTSNYFHFPVNLYNNMSPTNSIDSNFNFNFICNDNMSPININDNHSISMANLDFAANINPNINPNTNCSSNSNSNSNTNASDMFPPLVFPLEHNMPRGPKTEPRALSNPFTQHKKHVQKAHGAEKLGLSATNNSSTSTTVNVSETKLNLKKHSKGKGKGRRRKKEEEIDFVCQVPWKSAHRYHQYCPFCVKDARKTAKSEFWGKLPPRESLAKEERHEYDAQCKDILAEVASKAKQSIVFESAMEYRKHYDELHRKYGFKCIYADCEKESSSWYNFVAHLTQHDREMGRPFYCAFTNCNRRSSTKHNLIKHLEGVHKWKIINKEEPKHTNSNNSSSSKHQTTTDSATATATATAIATSTATAAATATVSTCPIKPEKVSFDSFAEKREEDVVQQPIINDNSQIFNDDNMKERGYGRQGGEMNANQFIVTPHYLQEANYVQPFYNNNSSSNSN
eukprot:CAMPEP_0197079944 /NCGR_PEP_ID=MMETSP1384-20130603/213881_1 /TAXON_ID=29189 /ORGANISM="Ammonia sp." /LENGTH=607 /DNA_ID=CAMNT_0042518825 /DNA_START=1 /DNA_END=1821 /DNA_ORIENTATION=+